MLRRPCLRNLDRPIIALWGLEPADLVLIFAVVGGLAIGSNIGVGLGGGLVACLGLKALKAGKPRGHVFTLCYRSGLLRLLPLLPAPLRPAYLVLPPFPGQRRISFSAAPGPQDDETPEARFFRGGKEYLQ